MELNCHFLTLGRRQLPGRNTMQSRSLDHPGAPTLETVVEAGRGVRKLPAQPGAPGVPGMGRGGPLSGGNRVGTMMNMQPSGIINGNPPMAPSMGQMGPQGPMGPMGPMVDQIMGPPQVTPAQTMDSYSHGPTVNGYLPNADGQPTYQNTGQTGYPNNQTPYQNGQTNTYQSGQTNTYQSGQNTYQNGQTNTYQQSGQTNTYQGGQTNTYQSGQNTYQNGQATFQNGQIPYQQQPEWT